MSLLTKVQGSVGNREGTCGRSGNPSVGGAGSDARAREVSEPGRWRRRGGGGCAERRALGGSPLDAVLSIA